MTAILELVDWSGQPWHSMAELWHSITQTPQALRTATRKPSTSSFCCTRCSTSRGESTLMFFTHVWHGSCCPCDRCPVCPVDGVDPVWSAVLSLRHCAWVDWRTAPLRGSDRCSVWLTKHFTGFFIDQLGRSFLPCVPRSLQDLSTPTILPSNGFNLFFKGRTLWRSCSDRVDLPTA